MLKYSSVPFRAKGWPEANGSSCGDWETEGKMVSIIVPVYNMEQYLGKCLESLVNQTYHNFEILLVNDGSTDASGGICDSYAEKYSYVKVFHMANGGQSSARNYALEHAQGTYITYVDSDDYVDRDYLREMVHAITEPPSDFVMTAYAKESTEGTVLGDRIYTYQKIVLTPEQALREICYEKNFGLHACGNLIPAGIARKYPFPEGRIYEDTAVIYKMIGDSKKISFIDRPLYHYIHRLGSTCHRGWSPSMMDLMDASTGLIDYINKLYPSLRTAAVHRYFLSANAIYIRACKESNYEELIAPIQAKLKEYWLILKKDKCVPFTQKIKYGAMAFAPGLYKLARSVQRI